MSSAISFHDFLSIHIHTFGNVLSLIIRVALYPLNHKQLLSMQQMQKIQPRLKVIQEKYANDKQKLNEEMMRLYRENNVNPAAGCLPLLVQLPILILLFNVLRSYDFAGTSFIGVLLGSSTIAGLAQAVGAEAAANGSYQMLTVFGSILKNPAGLVNINYYLGNLILASRPFHFNLGSAKTFKRR